MKFIKRLLTGLVAVIVILVVVAYVLPREVAVARSVQINAPASDVYPHIAGLKAHADWSPWLSIDPDVQLTYSGPDEGVGSKLEWTSEHPNVGNGKQEIIEAVELEKVVTALDFGDMGTAEAAVLLASSGEATNVTWTLVSDMGNNPVGRWMGLMMDRWVGADYEKGLGALKAIVEG